MANEIFGSSMRRDPWVALLHHKPCELSNKQHRLFVYLLLAAKKAWKKQFTAISEVSDRMNGFLINERLSSILTDSHDKFLSVWEPWIRFTWPDASGAGAVGEEVADLQQAEHEKVEGEMEVKNRTLPSEFFLLGAHEWQHIHLILFIILLLVYLMGLTANLTIILVTIYDSNLHSPMYFFLCNLAVLDITFSSTIVPKLLDIYLMKNISISYPGCFMQLFFFIICVITEYFLLAVMAYDRYVAICFPLRYSRLINIRICFYLALTSWGFGLMDSLILTGLVFQYSFTRSNKINHFFCDMKSLLKLSDGNTQKAETAIMLFGIIFGFLPLAFILVTYVFIIYNIMMIKSNEGKRKAFSTCSSHITVIALFFGIILSMYVRPKSSYVLEQDKILAVLYTSCFPALNPLIYSLRNKDVHKAIYKIRLEISQTGATLKAGGQR
ncbi:olfactory receptor 5AR1-like [Gastrophryne carolinensis]